jgi:hypothetical protein
MPALLCAARNATDLVHVSNTGPTFPHRVRGIKRVIVRTFEKVKLYKARHLVETTVAPQPDLLEDGFGPLGNSTLMDILEVPQRQSTAGSYRHIAKLMAELGWSAVRVRDFPFCFRGDRSATYDRRSARPAHRAHC